MLLDEILRHQAGVVTLAQVVACGLSADTAWRRVRSGAWTRLYPGVFLVGGHRLTAEVRIRAAALHAGATHAGDGPVVASASAAFWHGMLRDPGEILHVVVPPTSGLRSRPGLRVRRRIVDDADRVLVGGVAVTGPPRTALDTAVAMPTGGSVFLDRALQKHVRFPAVYRAYCRSLGSPGSAQAGRMITAAADGAESAAERLLVTILRRAGITGWTLGHRFGRYVVDLAFPGHRVAVEVDGWAWHVDVERFRADRRKGNDLVGAGWNLLRFTWHDLSETPADVVADIRAVLPRAA
ncbi:MAG: type IV toxin-antitoxin system AbiEi family antitoxin domain-containing protein [Pseudonocardia sediminis]